MGDPNDYIRLFHLADDDSQSRGEDVQSSVKDTHRHVAPVFLPLTYNSQTSSSIKEFKNEISK